MQRDFLGKVGRQYRPANEEGNCRDTAKVAIIVNDVKTVYALGRWRNPEADVCTIEEFSCIHLDIPPIPANFDA